MAENIADSSVILSSILLPSTFLLHDTLKPDLFWDELYANVNLKFPEKEASKWDALSNLKI